MMIVGGRVQGEGNKWCYHKPPPNQFNPLVGLQWQALFRFKKIIDCSSSVTGSKISIMSSGQFPLITG